MAHDVRTGQHFISGIHFSKQTERHPSVVTVCYQILHKNILGWHLNAVTRDSKKMWGCISFHSFNWNHTEKAYENHHSSICLKCSFVTLRMMSNLIEFQIEEIFWLIFCFQLYSVPPCGYFSCYCMHQLSVSYFTVWEYKPFCLISDLKMDWMRTKGS